MNFLALLLGLALERVLTHLFHLREFHWLDPVFDAHLRRFRDLHTGLAVALTLGLALLLVAPVALVSALLWDELLQIPHFLFSVLVLLFCLGPRDLDDEVEDYESALDTGDTAAQARIAHDILEYPAPESLAARNEAVERAIYVQANNRIFGVVFWFLLLGPTGAWLFRVLDLLRHRARVRASTFGDPDGTGITEAKLAIVESVRILHGVLAFIPSRLLTTGYVLAGNFEEAMHGWRTRPEGFVPFHEGTDRVVARVGIAAAGRGSLDVADAQEALDRIRAARSLVMRTLWMIWCPVIAVLTLYDWLV